MEGFHVSGGEGRLYTLGLRQLVTKSRQDTLSALQDVLSDINQVSTNAVNPVGKQILLKIESTMSDRAVTEQKINSFRGLQKNHLMENLIRLGFTCLLLKKMSLSRLNNFFCDLHAIVHLSETAAAFLDTVEKGIFGDPPIHDLSFKRSGKSATARLVPSVSNAFSCEGDEKCGVYGSSIY